jgi:hypothetical protein
MLRHFSLNEAVMWPLAAVGQRPFRPWKESAQARICASVRRAGRFEARRFFFRHQRGFRGMIDAAAPLLWFETLPV